MERRRCSPTRVSEKSWPVTACHRATDFPPRFRAENNMMNGPSK